MHRTAAPSLLIGASLMTAAVGAQALGFGRTDGQHLLGQPLTLRIPLNLDADETLGAECAAAEVLAGDQRVPADGVRASIEPGSEPGQRVLRITTSASIDEPVVTVNASVGCPTRLSRRFVLFLDPPAIQLAAPAPEASAPQASARAAASGSEPASAGSPSGPLARSENLQSAARPGARPAAPRRAHANPPLAVAHAPHPRSPAATASAAARSRLQLDPMEPLTRAAVVAQAASVPAPTVAEAASQAASAASTAASAASTAAETADRVRALEDSLARLTKESKAAQESLVEMRARLRAAETSRPDSWLLYGLGALVLLLAAMLGWVMRQRSREREVWWAAAEGASAASAAPAQEPAPVVAQVPVAPPVPKPTLRVPRIEPESAHASMTTPAVLQPTQPVPMADAEPRREVTVEELIDLEQQAEFFLVLGQDDAAIDLLMGHLRSTGGSSPLPYLKLLEIYRRRNERDAYERIRERFNLRFNAHAPAWETDFAHGRSLEDYPDVLARVQSLWQIPSLAMRELESLLFRQDQRAASFDLPAYREVLFLYSMARDLAQEESNDGVDLLLPIDEEAPPRPVSLYPDVPADELHIDLDLEPAPEDEVTQGRKPIG